MLMMVNLKNLYKSMEGLDNMKDYLFKILEEGRFRRKDNVIAISKNDISPLTKSLVKEVFGRESILIDDKISDCYIIIENVKFSQVVLYNYIKFVVFFMICNLINCVYYGYNFAYLDSKIFYSDRKSTRLNSSHRSLSRMPSSA